MIDSPLLQVTDLPPTTMADVASPPIPAEPAEPMKTDEEEQKPLVATEAAPETPAQEEHVSETLYIQNLNEKIKIDVLKQSLRALFKTYGEVLDVVAHPNLRMRGQAFVSFESTEAAQKALKEVNRFPLYSKPMVRRLVACSARRHQF